MSEFYESTPATRYFKSSRINLSGERIYNDETESWDGGEVILWVNYHFDRQNVSLEVYDDAQNGYRTEVEAEDFNTVVSTLQGLAEVYPDKKTSLDALLPAMKVFFQAIPGMFANEADVTNVDFGSCSRCGDYNVDKFYFIYVPAVPGTVLTEASLGLHWDFGCYGGREEAGTFDEVAEEVRQILSDMLKHADNNRKKGIRELISVVEDAAK